MESSIVARAPSDHRILSEQVRGEGLMDRRPWNYGIRIVLTVASLGAGWYALLLVGDSWAALGIAPFLAFSSTQILFLGHDAGHQQIFATRRRNRVFGLLTGDLLSGLSFGWWVPKHNAHHAYPNQVGRDPDIVGPSASVPTTASSRSARDATWWLKRTGRVALSVPLVFLELGMHLSSGRALARRRDRGAAVEWLLIASHGALYLGAVFWVLSPLRALLFIAVQQGMLGVYLRASFAPNHKGMPMVQQGTTMTFIERQVTTSRDLHAGWLTTFMLGGLNYQIEHHLFPGMPRPNLARAQPIVQKFCAEKGLEYRVDSVVSSYRQALQSLRRSEGELEDTPNASRSRHH